MTLEYDMYIYICVDEHMHIYIYIYATPPHRSMDFWLLLGRGRLRVFSNYLIQNAVSMKFPELAVSVNFFQTQGLINLSS